jgi:TfoX/Sxy family transcriptional regulator of competence genes
MAYDEDLANRLRELLAGEEAVTERKMFGGLAFLVHGHMCVSASHSGGVLARVDPDDSEEAAARPHAARMEMGGRSMDGWIMVEPEGVAEPGALEAWAERSLAYVRTLRPK